MPKEFNLTEFFAKKREETKTPEFQKKMEEMDEKFASKLVESVLEERRMGEKGNEFQPQNNNDLKENQQPARDDDGER